MNSSAFLAVASAALFVLVFQGGEAADIVLQKILRSKRDVETDASSDTKWLEYNLTRLIRGKISCVPTLTRDDYAIEPNVGAYKFHHHLTSWFDARKTCLAEGAQLAVMDSPRKRDLFQQWRGESNHTSIWLGFHDLFEEGKWVTMTGESIDTIGYNPWAKDEPDGGIGGLDFDCAMLFSHGLGDWQCSDPLEGFICEINLCETVGHRVHDTKHDH